MEPFSGEVGLLECGGKGKGDKGASQRLKLDGFFGEFRSEQWQNREDDRLDQLCAQRSFVPF